jgi:hypothetical protein
MTLRNSIFDRLDNSPVRHSVARLADDAPVPHADSWPSPLCRPPRVIDRIEDRGLVTTIRVFDHVPEEPEPPSLARAAVSADMKAQVAITVRALIKDIARDYSRDPRSLDTIAHGLSDFPPKHLVTALAYLIRTQAARRHMGFGGEVPAINLRGAMLYARYSRAKAHQIAGRAA